MRVALLIIGSLLPVASSLAYGVSIIRGKTRPQRMTHFLLVLITALTVGILWVTHDTSGLWLALTSFIQTLVVCMLSLKYGIGGRDRMDGVCLVLCVAGLVLWLLSDWPWVGLAASIAADFIAVLPALRKTIRLPHTELALFYAADTAAGLVIMLAGPFTIQAMLFPAYIALINFAFVIAIMQARRRLASNAPEDPLAGAAS